MGNKSNSNHRATLTIQAHCPRCREVRLFTHVPAHYQRHLLVTVLTLGLWAPVWLLNALFAEMRPWRCTNCRWHKPVFSGSVLLDI